MKPIFTTWRKNLAALFMYSKKTYYFVQLLFTVVCISAATTLTAREVDEIQVHDESIDDICVLNDHIYTASFDHTIKRTDFDNVNLIGAHNDWVRSLLCIDKFVISGSNDGQIRMWENNINVKTVRAHSWWITDFTRVGDKLVSISIDETVKIWGYPHLNFLYEYKTPGSMKHHTVTVWENRVYIGSTFSYSVLDLSNFAWLTVSSHINNNNILLSSTASSSHVYFGGSRGFVYQVDPADQSIIMQKQIDAYAIKAMTTYKNWLYVGNDRGDIYKLDLPDLSNYSLVLRQKKAVRALKAHNGYLIAGYDDGMLRRIQIDEVQ